MKKTGLLNAPLATILAELGHSDTLVIADAGLPIPTGTTRIDLAIVPGLPGFLDVLDAILAELCVEGVTLATEIRTASPALDQAVGERLMRLGAGQDHAVAMDYIDHEAFKHRLGQARAVVRTGECTPYANIILRCGVPF